MLQAAVVLLAAAALPACGGHVPPERSLRDSFARQVAVNKFIADFKQNGDELTFAGPTAQGGRGQWRIQIDTATIESNTAPTQPYKGTIKSSWFIDGVRVEPSRTDSNLPIELTSNGLSQDCWAFWERDAQRWSWE
jgi:hypothetical protein